MQLTKIHDYYDLKQFVRIHIDLLIISLIDAWKKKCVESTSLNETMEKNNRNWEINTKY